MNNSPPIFVFVNHAPYPIKVLNGKPVRNYLPDNLPTACKEINSLVATFKSVDCVNELGGLATRKNGYSLDFWSWRFRHTMLLL